MKAAAIAAALAVVLGACATTAQNGRVPGSPSADTYLEAPFAVRAQAALADTKGGPIGLVTLTEVRQGVRVDLRMSGLTPGKHGVHFHAVGKCDPPDFTTAGGHFNPDGHQHGVLNPNGPHAGDLPNIVIGADGHGTLVAITPGVNLEPGSASSLLSGGGVSIVVHQDPDDEKTDPSGNSGTRVACGIVKKIG